ncbi:hypothetical protein OAN61_00865 [bacterium]|nr:hypothetical protein [bacterium]
MSLLPPSDEGAGAPGAAGGCADCTTASSSFLRARFTAGSPLSDTAAPVDSLAMAPDSLRTYCQRFSAPRAVALLA